MTKSEVNRLDEIGTNIAEQIVAYLREQSDRSFPCGNFVEDPVSDPVDGNFHVWHMYIGYGIASRMGSLDANDNDRSSTWHEMEIVDALGNFGIKGVRTIEKAKRVLSGMDERTRQGFYDFYDRHTDRTVSSFLIDLVVIDNEKTISFELLRNGEKLDLEYDQLATVIIEKKLLTEESIPAIVENLKTVCMLAPVEPFFQEEDVTPKP